MAEWGGGGGGGGGDPGTLAMNNDTVWRYHMDICVGVGFHMSA